MKGAADRPSRIQVARSSILVDILRSSVVVAQAAAHRLIARKAAAGGSDEVRKTEDPGAGRLTKCLVEPLQEAMMRSGRLLYPPSRCT